MGSGRGRWTVAQMLTLIPTFKGVDLPWVTAKKFNLFRFRVRKATLNDQIVLSYSNFSVFYKTTCHWHLLQANRFARRTIDRKIENNYLKNLGTNAVIDRCGFMAVSRLFPLALAFSVALIIAVSTVYTFINGYSEDFSLVFKFKRNQEPSVRQSTLDKGMPFPHNNIRLPKQVLPLSYRIYIHPNLTTFKFTGTVNILLRCFQPTKNLILHIRDLSVGEIQLTDSKQKRLTIVRRMQHKENQQYLIATNEELKEKERYSLDMEFSGVLSKNMEGFYRSSYKTKSGQVRLVTNKYFLLTILIHF